MSNTKEEGKVDLPEDAVESDITDPFFEDNYEYDEHTAARYRLSISASNENNLSGIYGGSRFKGEFLDSKD